MELKKLREKRNGLKSIRTKLLYTFRGGTFYKVVDIHDTKQCFITSDLFAPMNSEICGATFSFCVCSCVFYCFYKIP